MHTFRAGLATVDITPPVGTAMAGFGARSLHSSTGVDHPLRAVALSVGDGVTDVIVVSLELLGCYEDLSDELASGVAAATGVDRGHVLLNASHTHCAPTLWQETEAICHGPVDREFRQLLVERVVTASVRAHTGRYPATLEYAVGRCDLAMNRRRPDPATGVVSRTMLPTPDGPTDHEVPVLVVRSTADRIVRGVVFSYACHPTSRGGLRLSGDYVGFALDAVEEHFPHAQPLFLQGCGGDQKVRPAEDGADTFVPRTLAQVAEAGRELGDAVAAAVPSATAVTGLLQARLASVDLVAEPATPEVLAEALASPVAYDRHWAEQWQRDVDGGASRQSVEPLELQVITIGDALVIVGMGGEMTVEHGLRLKRDLAGRFDHVIPLGYSNRLIGYVAVARQFPEYGYEVLDANRLFGFSGRWEPDTEDRVHAAITELVASLADR